MKSHHYYLDDIYDLALYPHSHHIIRDLETVFIHNLRSVCIIYNGRKSVSKDQKQAEVPMVILKGIRYH